MPELAEVEYYRHQWDPGLGQRVLRIAWHPQVRIFRGIDPGAFERTLTGARLLSTAAHGKQMLVRFDRACLGLHLGMTGRLETTGPDHVPGRHDHLAFILEARALVFSDHRLFGRVLFSAGKRDPDWWANRPADVLSAGFSRPVVARFLERRKKAPLKAVLLLQERFPGIGNWMADEILWRARFLPSRTAGSLSEQDVNILWRETRTVCRQALRVIGKNWGDPPDSWLFPHRWRDGGSCPRCGSDLRRAAVGGRTTCWCAHCQR